MRPRLVEILEKAVGSDSISFLVPPPALMYVLAMLVVMWVFVKRSEKTGLSAYHALGAGIWAMVGGLFGARIFYLLQHLKYTIAHPEVLFDISGGTTSWGAYSGGLIALLLYFRWYEVSMLPYLDILGASLGLGPMIGRWSCFLNGCCYGTFSTLPWAVRYPVSSFPFEAHMQAGLIRPDATLSLSIHPVQIYSSINGLLIFMLASIFWSRFKDRLGVTFIFYWLLYGTLRFVIEFFRGDDPRYSSLQLTFAQILCILVVGAAILALFIRLQDKSNNPDYS